MPIVTTTTPFSPEHDLIARTPRDDLFVHEVAGASADVFEHSAGPFKRWQRTVSHEDGNIVETVDYATAVPHWGWLIDILLRKKVRETTSADAPPWWSPSTRVSVDDVTVLGLCATLSILAGFLGGLVGQSITFIAEDFGATTEDQTVALAIIRVGAILTFIATALADSRGRRPILRAAFLLAGATAALTAAAPTLGTVTGLQLVCRGLIAAAALLIPVVCAEQIPATARAYSTGIMAASGGLGVGMVLWLLPLVDLGPWGWRLMFLAALPALGIAHVTLKRLPESRRFTVEAAAHHRGSIRLNRLALLGVALFLLNVFAAPVQQLQNDFLRTARDFNGTQVAVFLLLTNTWGGLGLVLGSQLADRRSRRIAASIGLVGLAVGNAAMFNTSGAPMWLASLVGSVVGAATVPAMGTLLPELFPTLRRGFTNGVLNGIAVIGSISGLLIARHYIEATNYGPTMAALALAPLVVAVLVWWLPETARQELEDLNEDLPPSTEGHDLWAP